MSSYNNVPGGASGGGTKKKKKAAIIGVSSLVLVAMVVAVAVGIRQRGGGGEVSASMKAIQAVCQPTDYKDACVKSLSSANSTDPRELVKTGFQAAIDQIAGATRNSALLKNLAKDPRASQALENCDELMDYAIDDLKASFAQLGGFEVSKLQSYVRNLRVWLSGAATYQQTCLDGFENATGDAGESMKKLLKTSQELTSNGLAMVTDIGSIFSSLQIPGLSRRLEEAGAGGGGGGLPSWVSEKKRRLLEAGAKPNVVVAKDGTGQFKTVSEAVNAIPKNSNATFVIYIKAGVYAEQVLVNKSMTHVMMVGDGPTKTRITGSLNFADGTQTFKTATVCKY